MRLIPPWAWFITPSDTDRRDWWTWLWEAPLPAHLLGGAFVVGYAWLLLHVGTAWCVWLACAGALGWWGALQLEREADSLFYVVWRWLLGMVVVSVGVWILWG